MSELSNDSSLRQQHQEGHKALILNIVFFAVMMGGILLVPTLGFVFSVMVISIAFAASIAYIYLT
ncbi:MAG: hypothetical protein KGZ57_05245 [Dethiobacter sp.]|nr:hypothetical protein [Dethiobacter sp.]MCL5981674.1 hypothetical protein [Bacillota bacterium]